MKLPPGVGTRTPEDVADAVVKAIERDRGEIDVAPLPNCAPAAMFAGLAPEIGARVARRLGSEEIAREMADGPARRSAERPFSEQARLQRSGLRRPGLACLARSFLTVRI